MVHRKTKYHKKKRDMIGYWSTVGLDKKSDNLVNLIIFAVKNMAMRTKKAPEMVRFHQYALSPWFRDR